MKNQAHFNVEFEKLLSERKPCSAWRLSSLLQYPHTSMIRIIGRIIDDPKKIMFGDTLLTYDEVIRLIMALPEYNNSFVNYAKWLLTSEICQGSGGATWK